MAGNGNEGFSGDGGPATSAEAQLPDGVAVDGAGNLVIADTGNSRVRVVAASTGTFYGQAMTAGDIYTVAGDGTRGSPATAARPPAPNSATRTGWRWTVRATCSSPTPTTSRVRVVAAGTGTFYGQAMTAGDIYTVAGDGTGGSPATAARPPAPRLNGPAGVAVDGAGNLLIADTGNSGCGWWRPAPAPSTGRR